MNAIILVGGFGTRLRPLTLQDPKPVLPMANRPFIESIFARLASAGVKRVVLSAYHQVGTLKKRVAKARRFGLNVSVAAERSPLGTGGAIRHAWPKQGEPSLVFNGDVLSDLDLKPFIKAHRGGGDEVTLWSVQVEDPSAFGVIEAKRDGRVQRFVEKPRPGESDSRWINAGLYLMEWSAVESVATGRAVSVEREVFPSLLAAGRSLRLFKSDSTVYWRDIGTPEAYLAAHLDIVSGALKLKAGKGSLWGTPAPGRNLSASGCRIAKDATVNGSCLGSRCRVGKAAMIEASVLWDDCKVGDGAQISGSLLGRGVTVGEGARLSAGTQLGSGAVVPPYSRL